MSRRILPLPRLAAVSSTLAFLACGAAPPPTTPCPSPRTPTATALADAGLSLLSSSSSSDAGSDDEASRRHFFEGLVALVRRFHVFSSQTETNLGKTWDAELPALEAEFAHAADRSAMTLALIHFGNSLHNPHCGFDPTDEATVVTLDATADVEWTDGKPVFYVSAPPTGSAIAAGDIITSVNGLPASELLTHDALRSNRNNWFGIAQEVAASLTRRSTRSTPEGSQATWTLQPRAGGPTKKVDLTWHTAKDAWEGTDYAVDYAHPSCAGLPTVDYGPYALTSEGGNFCLYTSKDARYRGYPIVRYFTFHYLQPSDSSYGPAQHRVRADHDALLAQLSAAKANGARAVLLDLRDNHGGNNPNWVMDWFAPAPYTDHYVFTKLDEALRDPDARRDANMDDPDETRWYLGQLDSAAKGAAFASKRPFFCRPDTCDWDNRYTPTHRVTTLPLALMVGPGCVSSCDSFTQQFDEFDFAPLVGEPTATGHTSRRIKREIRYRGEDLGTLDLAFSYEVSGKSGRAVEGVPIHLDERVDRTFANRAKYDALLVDRAIAALRSGKRGNASTPPSPAR